MKIFVTAMLICTMAHQARAGVCDDPKAKPGSAEGVHPIKALRYCVSPMVTMSAGYWASLGRMGDSECAAAPQNAYTEANQCLEERIVSAVDSAKGKDDLRAAVKDFYIKQKALVSAWLIGGQSTASYKAILRDADSAMDSAWDKVQLEAKLAGVSLEQKGK